MSYYRLFAKNPINTTWEETTVGTDHYYNAVDKFNLLTERFGKEVAVINESNWVVLPAKWREYRVTTSLVGSARTIFAWYKDEDEEEDSVERVTSGAQMQTENRRVVQGSDFEKHETGRMPETLEEAIAKAQTELRELMVSKQKAYGKGNITKFGELGILVRASDKLERAQNIIINGGTATEDEGLEDTWKDLANYGLIALLYSRGLWELPLSDEANEEDNRDVSDDIETR